MIAAVNDTPVVEPVAKGDPDVTAFLSQHGPRPGPHDYAWVARTAGGGILGCVLIRQTSESSYAIELVPDFRDRPAIRWMLARAATSRQRQPDSQLPIRYEERSSLPGDELLFAPAEPKDDDPYAFATGEAREELAVLDVRPDRPGYLTSILVSRTGTGPALLGIHGHGTPRRAARRWLPDQRPWALPALPGYPGCDPLIEGTTVLAQHRSLISSFYAHLRDDPRLASAAADRVAHSMATIPAALVEHATPGTGRWIAIAPPTRLRLPARIIASRVVTELMRACYTLERRVATRVPELPELTQAMIARAFALVNLGHWPNRHQRRLFGEFFARAIGPATLTIGRQVASELELLGPRTKLIPKRRGETLIVCVEDDWLVAGAPETTHVLAGSAHTPIDSEALRTLIG